MYRGTYSSAFSHSPLIEMSLAIQGRRCPVLEVGPDYVVVQSAGIIGPVQGTLTITVDGQAVTRWVSLPEGIREDRDRQPLAVLETSVPNNIKFGDPSETSK